MGFAARAWRLAAAATAALVGLAVVSAAAAPAAPLPARLLLDVGSLVFAVQETGTTSQPQALRLANGGGSPLHVSSLSATGAYAVDASACPAVGGDVVTLQPGESCVVAITFTPLTQGRLLGVVRVVTAAGTRTLPVEGGGSHRASAVSFDQGGLDFSPQKVGTRSDPQLITVRNIGNATLHAGSVAASGPFDATPLACPATAGDALTLAPGGSCVVRVTFTAPGAAGRQGGELQVLSDAPGAASAVQVTGLGVRLAPALDFDQGSLHFGAQQVATTSAPQQLAVRNTGRATLHVSDLATVGPFSITPAPGCPAVTPDVVTLPPGGACTLGVTFTPPAPAGTRTGSVRVTSDAAGGLYTLALEGLGTGGPLQPGALAAATGSTVPIACPAGRAGSHFESVDFALRVAPNGSVGGRQLIYRFNACPAQYVVRSTSIDRGSLVVRGSTATFSGQGVLAWIGPGFVEHALPGVYAYTVLLTSDTSAQARPGRIAVAVTAATGGVFHAVGTPLAPVQLASGNVSVRLR